MKLVCIFGEDNPENALFAVRYNEEEPDEFSRLFDLWSDVEYIESFCHENKDDLQDAFQRSISVEEAADEIMDEAQLMERQLYQYFDNTELQRLFKPLHSNEYVLSPLQESKASPISREFRRPKIRIYAIRLAPNCFIVTGGAIKLTATMNERLHLLEELTKIGRVKNWLSQNGIEIPEDLNEI